MAGKKSLDKQPLFYCVVYHRIRTIDREGIAKVKLEPNTWKFNSPAINLIEASVNIHIRFSFGDTRQVSEDRNYLDSNECALTYSMVERRWQI